MAFDELDIPRGGPRAAAPLSYRRHAAEQDGSRRLMLIGGGAAAGLLLLLGVMSLGRHGGGGVPVLHADPRPVRVRPADPGGMRLTGSGDDALIGDDGQNDALAAPDERPNPAALRGRAEAVARAQQAAPAVPAAPEATAATAAAAATAAPVAAAQPGVAQPAVSPPAAAAVAEAPPVAAPEAVAPKVATPAPVVAGSVQVQLAALTSEAAARAEWKRLVARAPGLLASHQPDISRTTHDDHVFWRLRTAGFADVAAATRFCVQLRALGAVCSLANF